MVVEMESPASLLIADDQAINRRLLKRLLEGKGHRVIEAKDGEEALEHVLGEVPDLLLLDVVMPGLDGFEVCRRIREDKSLDDLPVIFLTANVEVSDKIRGLEIGGSDYITKPFDSGEVLARVQAHLKIRHLTRNLREANRDLAEKQQRIMEDLRAASQIQRSLLPARMPNLAGVRFASHFQPCDAVGGDLFHAFRIAPQTAAVYVLDVSGHGLPAAMVTASVAQVLQPQSGYLAGEGDDLMPLPPKEALERLDTDFPFERFQKYFTMFYALLDQERGKLFYANGGHPHGIIAHADGSKTLLEPTGPLIGLGGMVPFEQCERDLRPGDRVLLYTDGIVEHQGSDREMFGMERLESLWLEHREQDLCTALESLVGAASAFAEDAAYDDDVTLLAFEYGSA